MYCLGHTSRTSFQAHSHDALKEWIGHQRREHQYMSDSQKAHIEQAPGSRIVGLFWGILL
jgi:hypothetical protein